MRIVVLWRPASKGLRLWCLDSFRASLENRLKSLSPRMVGERPLLSVERQITSSSDTSSRMVVRSLREANIAKQSSLGPRSLTKLALKNLLETGQGCQTLS